MKTKSPKTGRAPVRKGLSALLVLPLLAGTALVPAAYANPSSGAEAGVSANPAINGTQSVPPLLTQDTGAGVADNQNTKTAGVNGPDLLEDYHFLEKFGHFDRERIPERVVHARGVGVQGEFEASTDLSKYTIMSLFKPGKKTPIVMRLSTVLNRPGSPEWIRDPRGWAIKFKTETGNWDIVGIDFPVFFIRDAMKFPDLIHSQRPDPVSGVQDLVGRWDFFSNSPENTFALTYLYSLRYGVPKSLRQIDGFGVHAYRLVNAKGEQFFAKFHFKSRQGVEGMTMEEQKQADWNYATKDLYGHIYKGDYPKWDLYMKVLTPAQAKALPYDAFDDTKDWVGIPEFKIGTLTLNKVPPNFFQWTEQAAYGPGTMIPGIYPSPDKMLQGRLFSYPDTQRYRIGANYQDLEVNRPLVAVHNDQQDGAMRFVPQRGHTNYQPTSYWSDPWAVVDQTSPGNGKISASAPAGSPFATATYPVGGMAEQHAISPTDDFTQAGQFWRSLSPVEKTEEIKNLAADMHGDDFHQPAHQTLVRCTAYFYKADPEFGSRLAEAINIPVAEVKAVADKVPANP
ncbi:catalase [Oecophyllibacter saccharovorans]|uniref:Catalase n=1 Tax=Oecophyllibacter saccharovorans TaxID=2558360 RepID=A0A506UKG2_9PROT|nr:catalase [Oecophyllibacter saccharovorans]TPW33844.1 catalase [Oecophyllibacter saccharovorans]